MSAPSAPARDPVGLVFGAMAFGAVFGIGLQGLVTFGVDALKAAAPAGSPPSLTSPHALLLLLGTPAAIVSAGFATWTILSPLKNPWRQAMLAMIAGLGSFVCSLVAWPIHGYFGRRGLLALALLAGIGCVVIGRRVLTPRDPS